MERMRNKIESHGYHFKTVQPKEKRKRGKTDKKKTDNEKGREMRKCACYYRRTGNGNKEINDGKEKEEKHHNLCCETLYGEGKRVGKKR